MSEARQAPETDSRSTPVPGEPEAVYFLMWPGWETELVGNRWHFARRWARRVPVVLVQPTLLRAPAAMVVEPELRFDGCEILRVRASGGPTVIVETALIQTAQILEHARSRGYARPLLWCYNATLVGAFAALPAVGRVFHATENYFEDAGIHGVGGGSFEQQLLTAYGISDLVVAVSAGLADAIAERTGVSVEVVTNGCDFDQYAAGSPDAGLVAAAARYERIAIFAGNLNAKCDLRLALRAADAHPATLFALYGPVAELTGDDERAWRELTLRPNVVYGGVVPAARLPDLYAAADVGFIPYKHHPLLVENGFPLKTLEMAATGLPVVSTLMRPIVGLADAVTVTGNAETFLEQIGALTRRTLASEQREELIRVAAANDYDRKFDQVIGLLASRLPAAGAAETRLDAAVGSIGTAGWHEICGRWRRDDSVNRRSRIQATRRERALRALHQGLPTPLRRLAPARFRRVLRRAAFHPGGHA